MKIRQVALVACIAAGIGWAAGIGFSEEETPNIEEMMKTMRELGKPGAMHKHMEPMVGTWSVSGKFWMAGKESQTSATSTADWTQGGRFVRHRYKGEMFGNPFNGVGIMGYNNVKKQYEMVWLDDFASAITMSTGQASEDGKTITFNGRWEGPDGTPSDTRMVYEIGDGTYKLTSYRSVGPNEVKDMELTYTRTSKAVANNNNMPTASPAGMKSAGTAAGATTADPCVHTTFDPCHAPVNHCDPCCDPCFTPVVDPCCNPCCDPCFTPVVHPCCYPCYSPLGWCR